MAILHLRRAEQNVEMDEGYSSCYTIFIGYATRIVLVTNQCIRDISVVYYMFRTLFTTP